MLILAVDTSTRAGSVGALHSGQVLGILSDSEHVPYGARLFSQVAALQQQAKFSLRDVDVFAVATGPGSFTGLRVGLSATKAWAEVYDKPIAAIGALEAIAAQAELEALFVAACMDARRGMVFGAIYRREAADRLWLSRVTPEVLVSLDEFCASIREHCGSQAVVVASPTANLLAGDSIAGGPANIQTETVSGVLAPMIGRLALERGRRGEFVSALDLDANYVRQSDAAVKKTS